MKLIYDKDLCAWIDNWFTTHRYYHPHSKSTSIPVSELKDIVEQMPTIDAVPVVRCIDCIHAHHYITSYGLYGGMVCECMDRDVDENFYCADGERRTE